MSNQTFVFYNWNSLQVLAFYPWYVVLLSLKTVPWNADGGVWKENKQCFTFQVERQCKMLELFLFPTRQVNHVRRNRWNFKDISHLTQHIQNTHLPCTFLEPTVSFSLMSHLSLDQLHFWAPRRKWQPTPVFLPGESQGRGSLVGCRLWDRTESDMTEVT